MNMESFEEFSGSNDQMIGKGKRTKRPRQSSSTSSSGGGGGGGEFYSLVSSPTTSTSTEEDEDMANCLILLARGSISPEKVKAEEKFSRKFTEMATTINGKVGIYVYECKTCNRTFPSFQALGGHRASHKKPKPSTTEYCQKKSPSAPPPRPPDDQEEEKQQQERQFTILNTISPPASTQFPNKSFHVENKPKIHECSICGSEFASGQALGGHMRRHRSATAAPIITSTKIIETSMYNDLSRDGDDQKPRKLMTLDLNLPAPTEDDHRNKTFNQFPTSPQPQLVFSASALVDCHY